MGANLEGLLALVVLFRDRRADGFFDEALAQFRFGGKLAAEDRSLESLPIADEEKAWTRTVWRNWRTHSPIRRHQRTIKGKRFEFGPEGERLLRVEGVLGPWDDAPAPHPGRGPKPRVDENVMGAVVLGHFRAVTGEDRSNLAAAFMTYVARYVGVEKEQDRVHAFLVRLRSNLGNAEYCRRARIIADGLGLPVRFDS